MNHLFVDNLTVIDFAYLDHERGLVGESWIADVILAGELDDQGMVFDFGDVKRIIKQVIDDTADHRLIYPAEHGGVNTFSQGEQCVVEWPLRSGGTITHRSPKEAIVALPGKQVLPSVVATMLEETLAKALPDNVSGIEIRLREEEIDGPYYHYVHGLKKHQGNCQRIAHGHRSRIQIFRNQHRDHSLEQEWARRWRDIYIGTEADVSARFADNNIDYVTFSYTAQQGDFSLTLPRETVYLVHTDTTVELLAAHLAEQCKAISGSDTIQVKAFEGVGKGALATR
jgi:6-pyruvoyl-tetrahydropterin synthase